MSIIPYQNDQFIPIGKFNWIQFVLIGMSRFELDFIDIELCF